MRGLRSPNLQNVEDPGRNQCFDDAFEIGSGYSYCLHIFGRQKVELDSFK